LKLHGPRTYLRIIRWKVLGEPYNEPYVYKKINGIHGRLFVDIGARNGVYTYPLAKHFHRVYAFEPDHQAAEQLTHNAPWNVIVYEQALSNTIGKTMLYQDPLLSKAGTGGSSTILETFEYRPAYGLGFDKVYEGKTGEMVTVNTYDNLFKGITADLVKIDVEGAEFLVLEGMKESLAFRQVKNIVIELHDRLKHYALEDLLHRYGFRTEWLDPDHIYGNIQ